MSILDQYAKQQTGERRTKTAGTKLEPTLYNKFVEHCEERGLTTSEALRYLVIELLKKPKETLVNQSAEDKKPWLTKVSREKQLEIKGEPKGTKVNLQNFTVNHQLPCPICHKWLTEKNYARHCRRIHNIISGHELIQAHLEKVEDMVKEKHEQ